MAKETPRFTVISDEDDEYWNNWSDEFAKREFTEEELERMFSTMRKPPFLDTDAPPDVRQP